MEELNPLKYGSSNVARVGFEGTNRGRLHVQFHSNNILTVRGYYEDVPRAIYQGLLYSRQAGKFIHQHLKDHFKWHVYTGNESPIVPQSQPVKSESAEAKTYFYIPPSVPMEIEAIAKCIDAQIRAFASDEHEERPRGATPTYETQTPKGLFD